MLLRRLLFAAVLAFAPLHAHALFTPETGFYWTPNESGTGVAIEVQNQFLFATGYVYDVQGRPTFVSIQGPMVLAGDKWVLDTTLFVSSNGRCIGTAAACPYRLPNTVSAGTARIEFLAENVLTLRWNAGAGVQDLTLFRFAYFTGSEIESLLGEWDIIVDKFQSNGTFLFSGDKLQIESATTTTASGCATSLEGSPGCGNIRVQLTRTPAGLGSIYVMGVIAGDNTVLRRYNFGSLGLGGAFTQVFKGQVTICTNTTTSISACTGTATRFAAYRSASRQYAVSGAGMD